ncbi:MAG: molybdopterin-dependent oxidoreductase [Chloroflexota bacterium]
MCILCATNCGIEVQTEGRHITRVRGDKAHPVSQGYLCQKAARIDYYQNHLRRLHQPLKRQADGSFAPIDWDTAISEIAAKLVQLRDEHGGHSIAYYGGGGQGNHLPGAHAVGLRAALQTPYYYSSLAQEKTGDFWINGKLFGRQTCHVTEGIHEADYVILIGTNPFQSHGFPQARKVLREISKDPNRTLVVIDPRRTKTADLADIHIAVKPGTDAFLMTAMLATITQEGLEDREFLQEHTVGFEAVHDVLMDVDIPAYCAKAEVPEAVVREVARGLAAADKASTRHDLGVEMSLHSTLNCYLEKLLFLITGNFGEEGMNSLHTQFVPLIGHSEEPEKGGVTSKVTNMKEISKLFPPNLLPLEIDTDHPERIRALFVDSANPMQTAADTYAYQRAFEKLELTVVVDVAMTETAEYADYILPAPTQYEKAEATFFSFSFPTNYFYLRKPILEQEGNTLPEPEIYRRLLVAMGELPDRFPELEELARQYRANPETGIFPMALMQAVNESPKWNDYISVILYATLGKALPSKLQSAAAVWGAAQFYARRYKEQVRRAGYEGKGHMLGEALFNAILESPTAVPVSAHIHEETWDLVRHPEAKIHMDISEMLAEMQELPDELAQSGTSDDFPFVLAAGERRDYNANQIMRDPDWRRVDRDGALRIHPDDALKVGVMDGMKVMCESEAGGVEVLVELDDAQRPGFLSLPHGSGMEYPDLETEEMVQVGPKLNFLTSSLHCDPIAKTPYHKYVPVRLRAA